MSFWPQVDLLGADVYTPLTNKTNPTRAELAAGWRQNKDGHDMVATFRNLQAAYGKPFIFTEVGYRSADGANRAPWDWGASMPADPGEQADCYAALYEVWSRRVVLDEGRLLVGLGRDGAGGGRHRLQPARQARRGRAPPVAGAVARTPNVPS